MRENKRDGNRVRQIYGIVLVIEKDSASGATRDRDRWMNSDMC